MATFALIVPIAMRNTFTDWARATRLTLRPVAVAPSEMPRFVLEANPRSAGSLTDREHDVLRGMCHGLTYREIGRDLHITADCAKQRARTVFRKLGARDRSHAVHLAHLAGILDGAS